MRRTGQRAQPALAVVLAAGLVASLTGALERAVERELRRLLGPVERVEVKIERGRRFFLSPNLSRVTITVAGFKAEGLPLQQMLQAPAAGRIPGKIEQVVLRAERFQAKGFHIKLVEVRLRSVRYDLLRAVVRRQFQVLGTGERTVRVVLEEAALNRYLKGRVKELEEVRLQLLEGRLRVRGKARGPLGLRVPVELTAKLAATPEGQINLVQPRAKAWLFPMPRGRVEAMVAEVNPVVDLREYIPGPVGVELTGVETKPSGLTVRGRLVARDVEKGNRDKAQSSTRSDSAPAGRR